VLDGLRDELDALGLTRFDIQLPVEDSAVAPLEGALRVRANGARFVLETVDYGEAFRLRKAESEPEIKEAVMDYVSRPLPPVRVISRHELDTIVGKVALHYFDLRDRAREAGQRGIVIDLPAELPMSESGRQLRHPGSDARGAASGLRDLLVSGGCSAFRSSRRRRPVIRSQLSERGGSDRRGVPRWGAGSWRRSRRVRPWRPS
jgi:hypothetical protein